MRPNATQPEPPYAPFRVDVHPERMVVRVAPAGELDVTTASQLECQLHELRDSGFDRIVLDLRRVTFLDSTALALILAEDRRARERGHAFTLISGPPAVQRVLEVCGVAGRLRFEPSSVDVAAPRLARASAGV
ncbi:MAG TPA: STAS domain-containing protein [Solirubrobacteraceae bacterium]|nr:STAS domain-containing protein [Solirubrobacteraceae bacterium]